MKKQACWRGKWIDQQTCRYALYDISSKKELKQFGAYSAWDNPKAEEASIPYAIRIEKEAKAAGYQIVENPWD